jgi:hypothetical protein
VSGESASRIDALPLAYQVIEGAPDRPSRNSGLGGKEVARRYLTLIAIFDVLREIAHPAAAQRQRAPVTWTRLPLHKGHHLAGGIYSAIVNSYCRHASGLADSLNLCGRLR